MWGTLHPFVLKLVQYCSFRTAIVKLYIVYVHYCCPISRFGILRLIILNLIQNFFFSISFTSVLLWFFFFAVHMITLVLYSIWPWQLVVLLIFESVTYFDVYFFTLNTIQISEDFFFFSAWKKGCVIKHLVFPCFENCADTTSDAIGSTHVLTWIRKQLCSKCCVLV